MTAEDLIEESLSHNDIARATMTAALARGLEQLAEDFAEIDGDAVDYWGVEGGHPWRVQLNVPEDYEPWE